jgi:hypothetical protein
MRADRTDAAQVAMTSIGSVFSQSRSDPLMRHAALYRSGLHAAVSIIWPNNPRNPFDKFVFRRVVAGPQMGAMVE